MIRTVEEPRQLALEAFRAGPFYRLRKGLGIGPAETAVLLAAICWLLPVIALLFASATEPPLWWSFLLDPSAWAKFLIAPSLFVLAERSIGRAQDHSTALLLGLPIVASQSMPVAERALRDARRRSGSAAAELVCLLLAATLTTFNAWNFAAGNAPVWGQGRAPMSLNLVGWWCLVVSNTVFWFLLVRMVWKHLVWALLLRSLSTLDLRLAATHADGHAGLGFLGTYPGGYFLFNIGFSSVVAAAMAHQLQKQTFSLTMFSTVCGLWLAIVIAYFAAPLVGFSAQIVRLRYATLELALTKLTDFERANERRMLGRNSFPDVEDNDTRETSDVKALYQSATKMSAFILNKHNLAPLLGGSLLPIAAVGASTFPFSQLGPALKRLLFL